MKKVISVIIIIVCILFVGYCYFKGNESTGDMKHDAWNEATQFIDYMSDKHDMELIPEEYDPAKVTELENERKYNCAVEVKTEYDIEKWNIQVKLKSDGDWDVMDYTIE